MRWRLKVKGIVAIRKSTAKKCSRIIRCINLGEEGSPIDASHPNGDSQLNWGCTILNRVPSAAKPVKRIKRKRKRGIKDLFRCTRKKRVPASSAIPSRSAKRDSSRAGMTGMVKPIWARIMTIIGTTNPQNNMRWALPGPGFFRIFECPRI